ncbi:hypothetical protein MTR67_003856 [Solanum verrucosum]|uniref:Uncharacterized protein n=1 Tax=Solanum verrucosum TaxID=315347 RepID=A0AAF0PTH0_SOLVR|nr:hypothetical protein MTR67_003856 [Solanum verrucosum]
MSSFSNSSMTSVDEGRYCRCGNEALLKTSWTQLNPGVDFLLVEFQRKWVAVTIFFGMKIDILHKQIG